MGKSTKSKKNVAHFSNKTVFYTTKLHLTHPQFGVSTLALSQVNPIFWSPFLSFDCLLIEAA
jgi:hypothetical protein